MEATYRNEISIVCLMGDFSGHVAAIATLLSEAVDLCLVPEVKLTLHIHKKGFISKCYIRYLSIFLAKIVVCII